MWLPINLNRPDSLMACIALVVPPRSMRLLRKNEVSLPWPVNATGWAQPVMMLSWIFQLADDATPDLSKLSMMIGISTAGGATGNTSLGGLQGPDGATLTTDGFGFESLVLLDGATDELRIDAAYDPMPKINGEKKTGGTPVATTNGQFVLENQLVNNNAQYQSMDVEVDGKQWPPPPKQYHAWGKLKVGDATQDTLANIAVGPHGVLEIRLPWHAIWVTDPSSRSILWDDPATPDWDVKATEGIRVFVATVEHVGDKYQLKHGVPKYTLNGPFTDGWLILGNNLRLFTWATWDTVENVVERRKPVFYALKTAFAENP